MQRPEKQKPYCLPNTDAEDRQRIAGKGAAREIVENDVDRRAADPGIDPEPATGHQAAGQGRDFGADGAKGGAQQNRKRDALFGPGVPDQRHRYQNDEISEQYGQNSLPPDHAFGDQTAGQKIGRHTDHHADPQGGVGAPVPMARGGFGGRQIGVP